MPENGWSRHCASERACGACGDANALTGGREVSLLLPAPVTRNLIAGVEPVAVQQTLGETQRHRSVIAPAPTGQIERPASQHVPDRREASGAAVLSRYRNGISGGKPEQRALEAPSQSLSRSECRGLEQRIGFGGGKPRPETHIFGLVGSLGHGRP